MVYLTVWMRAKAPVPTRAVATKRALAAKRTLEGEKADGADGTRVCGRGAGQGGSARRGDEGRRGGGRGTLKSIQRMDT